MNNLFNQADVSGILARIEKLGPDTRKQWGKMNAAQMLAHCNVSMETAMGVNILKQVWPGKIIGRMMRAGVLGEKPFGKNSPTDKSYIFKNDLGFEEQRNKLKTSVTRFFEGGPSLCTVHPHPFFGKFTPDEWSVFQWKHLDHHLRQFGV